MIEKIDRYEVIELLGRGGMATVYRAHDPSFGRDVAVKVISPRSLGPTAQARFQREAKVIARLSHSAIVPIFDLGVHNDHLYYTMAYMAGGSLAERISQNDLSDMAIVHMMDRIAAALDAAHAQNIIHRDVKPANILFDQHGDAYLSDFGIVKLTEDTARLTTSELLGTPAYMAPEAGEPDGVSALLDVYALGVTLFQALTGELPYQADTPMSMIAAHIRQPVPDIRALRPDLVQGMQLVIEKALAKDPKMRFRSAGELALAVRNVFASQRSRPNPGVPSGNAGEKDASLSFMQRLSGVFVHWMRALRSEPQYAWTILFCVAILISVVTGLLANSAADTQLQGVTQEENIAYMYAVRDGDRYGKYFLSIMSVDGNVQDPIAESIRFSPLYTWSPDGKQLAAFSYGSLPTSWIENDQAGEFLAIISLDGTQTFIHETAMPSSYPAWSPDGSLIAYDCGQRDLCLFSTEDLQEKTLKAQIALFSFPQTTFSWSPDGSRLLYSCEATVPNANAAICVSDLNTAEEILIDLPGDDTDPLWSPNGTRFAFISQHDSGREQETRRGNGIFVARADGTEEVDKVADLPAGNYLAGSLAWSPDGRYIALTGQQIENPSVQGGDLIVAAVNGSMSRFIEAAIPIREPLHWSPDGDLILYSGNSGLASDIFLLNVASGEVLNLTDSPAVDSAPGWSPDGKWIVFVSNRDGRDELYRMDSSGGQLTRLTDTPGDEFAPLWSPP